MPRKARVVATDCPHHVTQRGNDRREIFFQNRDRQAYLETLAEYALRYELRIWGYCLMPNHIHLIAVPGREDSLARVLGRTHSDYARYANVLRRGCGHLWQARFYSCPLDEVHTWRALAYVERNPVRAGIVPRPDHYPWSSARAHLTGEDPREILDMGGWRASYTPERWADVLSSSFDEEALSERLREATKMGLPCGGAEFVATWEQRFARDLQIRKPGRPSRDKAMV